MIRFSQISAKDIDRKVIQYGVVDLKLQKSSLVINPAYHWIMLGPIGSGKRASMVADVSSLGLLAACEITNVWLHTFESRKTSIDRITDAILNKCSLEHAVVFDKLSLGSF